jgi:hypothetical protein
MFDGAADAANYQMKMFLGDQYVDFWNDVNAVLESGDK